MTSASFACAQVLENQTGSCWAVCDSRCEWERDRFSLPLHPVMGLTLFLPKGSKIYSSFCGEPWASSASMDFLAFSILTNWGLFFHHLLRHSYLCLSKMVSGLNSLRGWEQWWEDGGRSSSCKAASRICHLMGLHPPLLRFFLSIAYFWFTSWWILWLYAQCLRSCEVPGGEMQTRWEVSNWDWVNLK